MATEEKPSSSEESQNRGLQVNLPTSYATYVDRWAIVVGISQYKFKTLVSGGADHTIKLWDLATGEKRSPKHILEGHAGRVWCVAVSPDGSKIASASADFTVKLWNIETGDLRQTFTGHLGEV